MNDIFAAGWIEVVMPALAALFCLVAALALSSLVRHNKGAKINLAWGLIAFGLIALGIAGFDRTAEKLGMANAASIRDGVIVFGTIFVASGTIVARAVYRGLLK